MVLFVCAFAFNVNDAGFYILRISDVTMDVHYLSHLVYYLRAWGALWTTSSFAFEILNGELRKLFHGTRNTSAQELQYSN